MAIAQYAQPVVIAYVLVFFLYGISILQVYIYYMSFPKDGRFQKALVYSLFIMCTFQTALQMHDMVILFGDSFGHPQAFFHVQLGASLLPVTTAIVSCGVQGFYAQRIYTLSGMNGLRVFLLSLSVLQMLASIPQTVRSFHFTDYFTLWAKTRVEFITWIVTSAVCDSLIACIMTYYLFRKDFRLGGHSPMRKVSLIVIESGLLSALFAITACLLFLINPRITAYYIFIKSRQNVYFNTLLIVLNTRIWIIGGREQLRLDAENHQGRVVRVETTAARGSHHHTGRVDVDWGKTQTPVNQSIGVFTELSVDSVASV